MTNSDGGQIYFVYTHLPFGLKCAVHAITKMMKPVLARMHLESIRGSIYIDDGRILGKTREEVSRNMAFVYEMLQKAGWQLERAKSDKIGQESQVKSYLGFLVDTVKMKVYASKDFVSYHKPRVSFLNALLILCFVAN